MKKSILNSRKLPPESSTLIVGFLIVICVLGFFRLADRVVGRQEINFDSQILLSLRSPADLSDPIGPSFLEHFMVDVSALGSFAVIIVVLTAILGFLILRRNYILAGFILFAVLGGSALSTSLKFIYARPRPDLVPHLSDAQFSSFPSGHSMSAAVFYLTISALLAETVKRPYVKLYIMAYGVFIVHLVGISRVYIGVHWPSDVLAGWLGGIAWALICWQIQRRFHKNLLRRKVINPMNR